MTVQMDLINANKEIAGLQTVIAHKLASAPSLSGTKAAAAAEELHDLNDQLEEWTERRDALKSRVEIEQLKHQAIKAGQRNVEFQVSPGESLGFMPGHSSLAVPGSWGDAVLRANIEQGGMRGTKSLLPSGTAEVGVPVTGPIEDPRRARFLAELMPQQDAPGGHYAFLRQTVRTNNAAAVAEGALKPTSVYTLERVDGSTSTIAHLSESIPRQQLDASELVVSFVESEMRLGLSLALDAAIVTAIGAAGPLVEGSLGGDMLFTTRRAITRLEEREVTPSAFVLSPRDFEQVEREAEDQFASNANIPGPTDTMERRLWGVPVVVSNAVPENTAYAGDFRNSAVLYTSGGVRIDWSESHYDSGAGATDFERNLMKFRAEGRFGVAILRSFAFIQIALLGTGS